MTRAYNRPPLERLNPRALSGTGREERRAERNYRPQPTRRATARRLPDETRERCEGTTHVAVTLDFSELEQRLLAFGQASGESADALRRTMRYMQAYGASSVHLREFMSICNVPTLSIKKKPAPPHPDAGKTVPQSRRIPRSVAGVTVEDVRNPDGSVSRRPAK